MTSTWLHRIQTSICRSALSTSKNPEYSCEDIHLCTKSSKQECSWQLGYLNMVGVSRSGGCSFCIKRRVKVRYSKACFRNLGTLTTGAISVMRPAPRVHDVKNMVLNALDMRKISSSWQGRTAALDRRIDLLGHLKVMIARQSHLRPSQTMALPALQRKHWLCTERNRKLLSQSPYLHLTSTRSSIYLFS